jgi:hypothetical protein
VFTVITWDKKRGITPWLSKTIGVTPLCLFFINGLIPNQARYQAALLPELAIKERAQPRPFPQTSYPKNTPLINTYDCLPRSLYLWPSDQPFWIFRKYPFLLLIPDRQKENFFQFSFHPCGIQLTK